MRLTMNANALIIIRNNIIESIYKFAMTFHSKYIKTKLDKLRDGNVICINYNKLDIFEKIETKIREIIEYNMNLSRDEKLFDSTPHLTELYDILFDIDYIIKHFNESDNVIDEVECVDENLSKLEFKFELLHDFFDKMIIKKDYFHYTFYDEIDGPFKNDEPIIRFFNNFAIKSGMYNIIVPDLSKIKMWSFYNPFNDLSYISTHEDFSDYITIEDLVDFFLGIGFSFSNDGVSTLVSVGKNNKIVITKIDYFVNIMEEFLYYKDTKENKMYITHNSNLKFHKANLQDFEHIRTYHENNKGYMLVSANGKYYITSSSSPAMFRCVPYKPSFKYSCEIRTLYENTFNKRKQFAKYIPPE